jgi:hypothetical protein
MWIEPGWRVFRNSGYNFARWRAKPVKVSEVIIILPLPQALELITVIKE